MSCKLYIDIDCCHKLSDIKEEFTMDNFIIGLIVKSQSIEDSKKNQLYSTNNEFPIHIYYTVGVHPHNTKHFDSTTIINIISILTSSNSAKCIAIGECGLDYERMYSSINQQITAFELQIEIALKYSKPLYMHCRGDNAFNDLIMILKKYSVTENIPTGVVHCWTGTYNQAKQLTDLGIMLGINSWIFDEKQYGDLIDTVERIDLDFLMVETYDLSSIEHKTKSVPTNIISIVEKIAQIKKIDTNVVAHRIYTNTKRCFHL